MARQFDNIFVRVIYFRNVSDKTEVLMQERESGVFIFPGGRYEDTDGDFIETAYREFREETFLQRRMWFIKDLLYESKVFLVTWGNNMDYYFLLEWKDWLDLHVLFEVNNTDEDAKSSKGLKWVKLYEVVQTHKYHFIWHANTLDACGKVWNLTTLWTNPLRETEWLLE